MVHKTNRSRLLGLWLVSAKRLLAAVAVKKLLFQAVSHHPEGFVWEFTHHYCSKNAC